jgi:bacterioferritin-associated ferredoxin
MLKAIFNIKRQPGTMYVCLCVGVSEREIQSTLREGACTVEEVMYCTGAGTRCGSCVPSIEAILAEEVPEDAEAKSCRRRLQVVRIVTSAA